MATRVGRVERGFSSLRIIAMVQMGAMMGAMFTPSVLRIIMTAITQMMMVRAFLASDPSA